MRGPSRRGPGACRSAARGCSPAPPSPRRRRCSTSPGRGSRVRRMGSSWGPTHLSPVCGEVIPSQSVAIKSISNAWRVKFGSCRPRMSGKGLRKVPRPSTIRVGALASEVQSNLHVRRRVIAETPEERRCRAAEDVTTHGGFQTVGNRVLGLGAHGVVEPGQVDDRCDFRLEGLVELLLVYAKRNRFLDAVELVVDRRLLGEDPTVDRVGHIDRIRVIGDDAQHELCVDVQAAKERSVGAKYQKEKWALYLVILRMLRKRVGHFSAEPVRSQDSGGISSDDLDPVVGRRHKYLGQSYAGDLEIGIEVESVEKRKRPVHPPARRVHLEGELRDRFVRQVPWQQYEGVWGRLDGNDVRLEGWKPHADERRATPVVCRLDSGCSRALIAVFGHEKREVARGEIVGGGDPVRTSPGDDLVADPHGEGSEFEIEVPLAQQGTRGARPEKLVVNQPCVGHQGHTRGELRPSAKPCRGNAELAVVVETP